MTYLALARKWRPHSFEDVVGQASTLRILTHALEKNRVHHAYLFTGTRGVGKTTLARILAKCLNCEKGVTANPCGSCANCVAIDAGKYLDLYEIDAASRTKVEDTRDLLENVSYPPTVGRYKIYLIDEVHMLSQHSFNALLKTLEEPPAHVKFLLATTDPKRLPVTILSRCLQFHLQHMTPDIIRARLVHIMNAEHIPHDDSALALIAKAATGSMRDALSLLDQAIAFGSGTVHEADVRNMLGSVSQGEILPLLEALAKQDSTQLFSKLKTVMNTIGDANSVLEEVISMLHAIAFAQLVPNSQGNVEVHPALVNALSPETVQLYYQIALLGRRDLHLASTPQQGLEMVFLRMLAFTLQETSPQQQIAKTSSQHAAPAKAEHRQTEREPIKNAAPIVTQKTIPTPDNTTLDWHAISQAIGLSGMAQMLASNCALVNKKDNHIQLLLSKQHASMLTEQLKERIQSGLATYFSEPISLSITVGEITAATPAKRLADEKKQQEDDATKRISQNPVIKHFLDRYDTTLELTMLSS